LYIVKVEHLVTHFRIITIKSEIGTKKYWLLLEYFSTTLIGPIKIIKLSIHLISYFDLTDSNFIIVKLDFILNYHLTEVSCSKTNHLLGPVDFNNSYSTIEVNFKFNSKFQFITIVSKLMKLLFIVG